MEEISRIFSLLLKKIDNGEQNIPELSQEFANQVYAEYVDELLKTHLDDESYNTKIVEYKQYIKSHEFGKIYVDIQQFQDETSEKLLALVFWKRLRLFLEKMVELEKISPENLERLVQDIQELLLQNKLVLDLNSQSDTKSRLDILAS